MNTPPLLRCSQALIVSAYLDATHAMTTGSTPLATENAHHSNNGKAPPLMTSSRAEATGVKEVAAFPGNATQEIELPAMLFRVAKTPSPSWHGKRLRARGGWG